MNAYHAVTLLVWAFFVTLYACTGSALEGPWWLRAAVGAVAVSIVFTLVIAAFLLISFCWYLLGAL